MLAILSMIKFEVKIACMYIVMLKEYYDKLIIIDAHIKCWNNNVPNDKLVLIKSVSISPPPAFSKLYYYNTFNYISEIYMNKT